MRTRLSIALLSTLTLAINACYSYRTIENVNGATIEGELRVTTTDGRTFNLRSWELDSSGTLIGMHQIERREERPVQIPRSAIKTIEQREFDVVMTIVLSVLIGIPVAMFFTALASWG